MTSGNYVLASPDADEWYQERAAILEFDAGMDRTDAEALAMTLTLARFAP